MNELAEYNEVGITTKCAHSGPASVKMEKRELQMNKQDDCAASLQIVFLHIKSITHLLYQ